MTCVYKQVCINTSVCVFTPLQLAEIDQDFPKFAVLQATMLCVQGSRSHWKSLGIVDGASISESD